MFVKQVANYIPSLHRIAKVLARETPQAEVKFGPARKLAIRGPRGAVWKGEEAEAPRAHNNNSRAAVRVTFLW